jgi:hypothetical protein
MEAKIFDVKLKKFRRAVTGVVKKTDCKGVARNKNVGKTKATDKYLPTFLPTKIAETITARQSN